MKKTLLLGVGNSILRDDAVGIVVARKLKQRLGDREDVFLAVTEEAGFALLEHALGFDRLVVIDSIKTGDRPGTLHRLSLEDLNPAICATQPHTLDLATVLELGRRQGLDVPREVRIYGIEVKDNTTFSEALSDEVAARVPGIVEQISREIPPGPARRGGGCACTPSPSAPSV